MRYYWDTYEHHSEWELKLVGGFKHFFSISYMGCHPSHWLSYFSRWLLHHQPVKIPGKNGGLGNMWRDLQWLRQYLQPCAHLDGRLAEAWPRAVTGWEVTHSSQGEKMRRVDERCYTWSIHVNLSNAMNFIWLVVWNHGILWLSIYWECHHPNWRTHIFQRGRSTTNQILNLNEFEVCGLDFFRSLDWTDWSRMI